MHYKRFVLLPGFETNTWLLWKGDDAVLVDPSQPGQALVDFVAEKQLNIRAIVITHGHCDHIGGVDWARKAFDAPVWIHELDASMLTYANDNLSARLGESQSFQAADRLLKHGETLELGEVKLRVIHTPGHTRGGICLLGDGLLVSGDTLFDHSVGRTDLPGGDMDKLIRSINDRLLPLDGGTIVLPGHGGTTTIEDEAVGNPYVGMMR